MARFASDFEDAVVNVRVAIAAGVEGKTDVPDHIGVVGLRLVALLAGYTSVLPRQGEVGLGVIELSRHLPIIKVVAQRTILSELFHMLIHMAGEADT